MPDGSPVADGENMYVYDMTQFPAGETSNLALEASTFISGMYLPKQNILLSPIRMDNTGYGPLDVERSIMAGIPPFQYEAINGNFDSGIINWATSRYEYYLCRPQLLEYEGIDIYSWDGESRLDMRLSPPIFDSTGRGRTLAVQPHDIFGSTKADYVNQMIDTSHGKVESLAKDPLFQTMAESLERMGVMTVMMTDTVLKPDNYLNFATYTAELAEYYKQFEEFFKNAEKDAPFMGPYSTFALGLGKDNQKLFLVIMLMYDSAEKAESEIEVFKNRLAFCHNSEGRPYREEIDSSEVWVDGTALCAKLTGNVVNYWSHFKFMEPLLVRVN
jgi:hypothetical protein